MDPPNRSSLALPPSPRPRSLVLVRHGETEWSRIGRHTGQRANLDLTADGEAMAAALRPVLGRRSFARVLSSPLGRALRTAALAGFPDPEIAPELAEWDYGRYEGLTLSQIRADHPDWLLYRDGAPDGESPAQVADRLDRLLVRLGSVEGDVLLFAHGHSLRVLVTRWLGLPITDGRLLLLQPATLSELGWERGEQRVLVRWNTSPG